MKCKNSSNWKIEFTAEAISNFNYLPIKYQEGIRNKLKIFKKNPYRNCKPKPLKGKFKGFFRIRCSSYRIIYKIEEW